MCVRACETTGGDVNCRLRDHSLLNKGDAGIERFTEEGKQELWGKLQVDQPGGWFDILALGSPVEHFKIHLTLMIQNEGEK